MTTNNNFKICWFCYYTLMLKDNEGKIYTINTEQLLKILNTTKLNKIKNTKNIKLEVV